MSREQRCEQTLDLGESFVEADLDELAVALHQRPPEPVGIVLETLQGGALRAEEAGAVHVVPVAPNQRHVAVDDVDLEPASGLAERAYVAHDRGLRPGAHAASLARM